MHKWLRLPEQVWAKDAACRNENPDNWYPDSEGKRDRYQAAVAKRICRQDCPVTGDCLQWALTHDERFGIWGGMEATERERLRRRSAVR